MNICLLNEVDKNSPKYVSILAWVATQNRVAINVIDITDGDLEQYIALEGSHRLVACLELGITVDLTINDCPENLDLTLAEAFPHLAEQFDGSSYETVEDVLDYCARCGFVIPKSLNAAGHTGNTMTTQTNMQHVTNFPHTFSTIRTEMQQKGLAGLFGKKDTELLANKVFWANAMAFTGSTPQAPASIKERRAAKLSQLNNDIFAKYYALIPAKIIAKYPAWVLAKIVVHAQYVDAKYNT